MSDMKDLVISRYLPYGKETIINRAVPYIDGFKPVTRKTLYTMYELNLFGTLKKCARIVGDTMGKYHPHGDTSIYENLCLLTDEYAGFNAPLVRGQGNFGKASSSMKLGIAPAKMRYTEAGFTPLAKEIFDGIKENAVDMVDNFDETEKEPALLPVKFPNIIVNTNKGVAVGMSSYTPSYTLRNACLAVASILRGQSKSPEDVVDILGAPDFSTGGYIHTDKELLLKLLKEGRATFTLTGSCHVTKDSLIIDTIPVSTKFETVMEQIKQLAQTPEGREINDVTSNFGLGTTGITVTVKNKTNFRDLLMKLYRHTDLRDKVSFISRIIWKDHPEEMGVYQLMETWIEFRSDCVKRVYTVRAAKLEEKVHKFTAWEIIKDNIPEAVKIMSENSEDTARRLLNQRFGLDPAQLDYLMGMQIRNICTDKAIKCLDDLAKAREELKGIAEIRDDEKARYNLIASELEEIAEKYGTERRCVEEGLVPVEQTVKEKVEIPDMRVNVYITDRKLIKAVSSTQAMTKIDSFVGEADQLTEKPINASLREHILVFTYSGYCYKIPVHMIDATKGQFKQSIWDLIDRKDRGDICYICGSGDYSGNFNIIYANGSGRKIFLRKVSGRSKCYTRVFEPATPDTLWVTTEEKFFLITRKRKAAYADTTSIGQIATREKFKIARITSGDYLFTVWPAAKVPDIDSIDINRYLRGYCVSIGDDELWEGANKGRKKKEEDAVAVEVSETAVAVGE